MTQDQFDRRFDRVCKVGFATLIAGTALAIFIGLPAFGFFGRVEPFFAATAVVILGGCICVGNFTHDIFCNPRWKR